MPPLRSALIHAYRQQADGTEISRTIGHHFDNAVALSSGRVDNPFWPVLERIFPYGKKLRADIDFVHKYSRMFVREAVERIRQEENGEKDLGDEEDGLFIRRCLQTDMTENEIADSCVNLLLAGGHIISLYTRITEIYT